MRRLLLVVPLALGACGGDDTGITVLAASSLTDAFGDLGAAFGGDVTLSFGASSALRIQVEEGAGADVLAVADDSASTVFATNRVAILVPDGNPEHIDDVGDLAGRRLALCARAVPCGRYADEAFAAAGIERPDASEEENVRGVVQKVTAGEADAGIGYATDAGPGIDAIPTAIRATLTIEAVTGDGEPFVDFVLSDEGRSILRDHGFGAP